MSALVRRQALKSLRAVWCGKPKVVPARGAFLIEVLLAVSITVVVVVFVSATIALFVTVREGLTHDARKYYLAEEGYEMARFLRDEDWDTIANLTTGAHYGFSVTTTTIAIVPTPELVDGRYARTIVVMPLRRAADGSIVSGNGAVDPEGRRLEVFVADERGTTTLKAVLTNLFSS